MDHPQDRAKCDYTAGWEASLWRVGELGSAEVFHKRIVTFFLP